MNAHSAGYPQPFVGEKAGRSVDADAGVRAMRRLGDRGDAGPMTTTSTLPATGTYTLDPERTAIRCDCKAMFGAFTVHGTLQLSQGQVSIDADPARSSVRAVIDAQSYSSGNPMRDHDVRSATLLDTRTYPEISFAGSSARPDGDGWVVDGSVTAHGVTQPVALRLREARQEGGLIRFRATATLDRTAFGITKKKGMVGRAVTVVIDAVAGPA
jgi:polyisoprenoid-binding protein YceI